MGPMETNPAWGEESEKGNTHLSDDSIEGELLDEQLQPCLLLDLCFHSTVGLVFVKACLPLWTAIPSASICGDSTTSPMRGCLRH